MAVPNADTGHQFPISGSGSCQPPGPGDLSVLQQDFEGSLELSIFNDASKDKSMTIIERWKEELEGSGILVVIGGHDSPSPRGGSFTDFVNYFECVDAAVRYEGRAFVVMHSAELQASGPESP
ncbi:hypothetical protein CB1_000446002 [Camelus ferus]|nr:hypothetical protein CB1_000446002 [Camelus ferus]